MKIISLLIAILLTSCTMTSPVSLGQGEFSGKHVKDCSTAFLGMVFFADANRIDNVLTKYQLGPKDVYTIEQDFFHFLFPFYAEKCTIISLNKEGLARYMTRINSQKQSIKNGLQGDEKLHSKPASN